MGSRQQKSRRTIGSMVNMDIQQNLPSKQKSRSQNDADDSSDSSDSSSDTNSNSSHASESPENVETHDTDNDTNEEGINVCIIKNYCILFYFMSYYFELQKLLEGEVQRWDLIGVLEKF